MSLPINAASGCWGYLMYVLEPERKTPIVGDYDVIVCGAGPAGVTAAISAGRLGAKTLLIESQGCLGGIWTAGLLCLVLDLPGKGGILREIEQRLQAQQALLPRYGNRAFTYDVEAMKWLLEQMCREANVDVRLHTRITSVVRQGDTLQSVITESASGREAFSAKVFVDATGNGDVGALAGCRHDRGHPESGKTQPATMLAIINGVPADARGTFGHDDKVAFRERLQSVGFEPSYRYPSLFELPIPHHFCLMINHEFGVACDSADDITRATMRARDEVRRAVQALRDLGWTDVRLVVTPSHIGLREGRRIHGRYMLTVDDLRAGQRFDDGICLAHNAVDIHALDRQTPHGQGGFMPKPYHIPLRSLIAADVDNLALAGRCISGDFFAHGSYRVTGNAVPTGEAAGIAAAYAVQSNCALPDVDGKAVREEMERRGYAL